MHNSPTKPIPSDADRIAGLELDRDAHRTRLDSLADYVNQIDGNLDSLVSIVETIQGCNELVTTAITLIGGKLAGLHARLDDHRRHNRQIDDRYGIQSAQLASIETLVARLRDQVGNLETELAQHQFAGAVITGGGFMVKGEQHQAHWVGLPRGDDDGLDAATREIIALSPKDLPLLSPDAHLESDHDDRNGDDGS